MKFQKLFLASAISSLMLAGCGEDNDSPAKPITPPDDCGVDTENRILEGDISCNVTLDSTAPWTLKGIVNVGNGGAELATQADVEAINKVTLTIEPGTEINADADGTLIVTRGSKLIAAGTRTAPITFSSEDEGYDGTGEWGGVIIQGFAPHYAPGTNALCSANGAICNVQGEGGDAVAYFGGEDAADNSGKLSFVRIAEAGKIAGPDNEINGLTLQGVGHGTELSYIQVHGNLDDGIEWFGGTADLKYAVLTNNDDDDLDFDEGYQGHIQHVLIIKDQDKTYPTGKNDPRGIEANSSDDESVEATKAVLSNISIIGSNLVYTTPDLEDDLSQQPGMRLRGDLTVSINNSLVSYYHDCIRVDNGQNELTDVTLKNVLVGGCEDKTLSLKANGIDNDGKDNAAELNAASEQPIGTVDNNAIIFNDKVAATEENAQLDAPFAPQPLEGRDFTFDATDYIGAVNPEADEAFWEGWTIEGSVELLEQPEKQASAQ